MLQTYKTSPESSLEFLLNLLSSANFKHQAPNFNFLFQPLLKMANNGLKQKIEIKSLMFKFAKLGEFGGNSSELTGDVL